MTGVDALRDALKRAAIAIGAPTDVQPNLERPRDPAHGDWASNVAMTLAKPLGKKPRDVAEALIAALDVMETDPQPMERLWSNTRYWKAALTSEGFDTMGSETPITPVFVGEESAAQEMERLLLDEGVYALAIIYPTVARGKARLRTMPNAAHTEADLDFALSAFCRVRDKMRVRV